MSDYKYQRIITKEDEPTIVKVVYVPDEVVKQIRADAIDDFLSDICKMIVQLERNGNYRFYAVEIKQSIADLAQQLKAGVEE